MSVNATSIIALARANKWTVTKTSVDEKSRSRSGEHKRWSHVKSDTDTFDIPTHIVTFKRGDQTMVMPVTPDAGLYSGLPTQSVKEYDAAERYRYVRGNRTLGIMSGPDGKPILLPEMAAIMSAPTVARKAAAKPKRKTATKKAS